MKAGKSPEAYQILGRQIPPQFTDYGIYNYIYEVKPISFENPDIFINKICILQYWT